MEILQKRITKFKGRAVTNATLRSRRSQWLCYKDFCVKLKQSYWCMSLYQLSLYIVFLSEFMSHSSIVSYLHALRFMSYQLKFPVPEISHPEIKFILRGIQRSQSHVTNPSKPMRWSYFKLLF